MPVISRSTYHPPLLLRSGHLQTIYPNLFRQPPPVVYRRQRLELLDGDFLDVDWSTVGARRVAVVVHGLEGNSSRLYVLGMVRALNRHGWDALALNFRGCSGEPNRQLRFYHSGDTADLHVVVEHVIEMGDYEGIALIGFSLGGNVVLKYLGEQERDLHPQIVAAVAFSVPCDLAGSARQMARPANVLYMKRFLKLLHAKVRAKMNAFPGKIDDLGFEGMRSFEAFDDRYTAPLHGFQNAWDYWTKSSSKPLLPRITCPSLLVNALDDPFLSRSCYPFEEAEGNPSLYFETPATGGHVGFVARNGHHEYWSESRAMEFLSLASQRVQLIGRSFD